MTTMRSGFAAISKEGRKMTQEEIETLDKRYEAFGWSLWLIWMGVIGIIPGLLLLGTIRYSISPPTR